MSLTHLGHDVALESDEEEADAVEQVFIAAAVSRPADGGKQKGLLQRMAAARTPPRLPS